MLSKNVTCYFFVCFVLASNWLSAQNINGIYSSTEVEAYEKAKKSIYLLKNETGLIPLKRLDTLRISSLCFGMPDRNIFQKTLEKYIPIEYFAAETANLGIIALDISNDGDLKYFDDRQDRFMKNKIPLSGNSILVIFNARNIDRKIQINFKNWQHVIFVDGAGRYSQSLAAQLLFGAVGTDNKLTFDLNENFKKGFGLTTEGSKRLGYAPPGVTGMNTGLLKDSIAAIVLSAIDSAAFPGCQVLVAKNGQVVFHEAWGYHTFEEKRPVKTDDIYDYASLTKITSALPALMKFHGEGRFKPDAPLKAYFPKFKNSNKADLSMRDILAHYASLKPWIPYWRNTIKKNGKYKWRTFKSKPSRRFPVKITDDLYLHRTYKKRIYKAIRKSRLNGKKTYKYSGLAFYLFPEIVSRMAGQDFESYLKQTFYQKLGAYSITYNPAEHFPLERIIPTENDTFFRKIQIHGTVHDEGAIMMGGVSANAGLFSTANDLAKLMQMYLNGGAYGGERYIAESSVREFTRCQFCGEGNRRGLGFDKPLIEYDPRASSVAKDASPGSFGHSGYTGTFTWVDPEHELIYIFFSNRVFPTRENRKLYELNVRPRIHQVIYDSFLK